MGRKGTTTATDLKKYKAEMAEVHRQAKAAFHELGRVVGILAGAENETIDIGVVHRLKSLRGHCRALADAREQAEYVRQEIMRLHSAYVP